MSIPQINTSAANPVDNRKAADLLADAIAAPADRPPATRAEVISLARDLTAKYRAQSPNAPGSPLAGPVQQALGVMADVYRRATTDESRELVCTDADQLLQLAKEVGFLPKTHTRFVDFVTASNPQPAPSVVVAPPPPVPAPAPAPAPAGVIPPDSGFRVARPWDSRLEPFGRRLWTGARVRTGPGEPSAVWNGLPRAPYTEVGAGMVVTAGAPFDPRSGQQTVTSLAPRYQVYFDRGTPTDRIRAAGSVQAATLDPNGRHAADLQLSGVRRWPDGATTRGAIQIGTPPPKPGAGPAVDALLEHVHLDGLPAPIRGRVTLSRPGDPGVQTVGVTVGMPGPGPGTFPSEPRPVGDLAATWKQAPAGKSLTTLAATVGYAGPSTVATTTVRREQTQSGQPTTTLSFAAWQRLQGSVGDPNTSTAAGGIDPQGVPTGRFPAGAEEPITTLYVDGSVRLERSARAAARATLGPDRVRVGIVHNRPEGPIPTLYGEFYGDLTPYAGGQSPPHGRLGGEIGIRMRPAQGQPVTIDAALRAGAPGPRDRHGGTAVHLGVTVEIDPDTAVQGGVQIPLSQQQDDPGLSLRLTRRL